MKPYYEHAGITIYHGNCLDILQETPSVDMILTDPPYGNLKIFNKDGSYRGGTKSREKFLPCSRKKYGRYHDEGKFKIDPFLKTIEGKYRDLIIWGGNYFQMPVRTSWLCWDKSAGDRSWFSQFELAWSNLPISARIFHHAWQGMVRKGEKIKREHPTQKPVELMSWCIQQSPQQVNLILDPFMGSGSTLRAAKDHGKKAIGIEIDEKYCEIAAKRMAQEIFEFVKK